VRLARCLCSAVAAIYALVLSAVRSVLVFEVVSTCSSTIAAPAFKFAASQFRATDHETQYHEPQPAYSLLLSQQPTYEYNASFEAQF
jgi:uncharacterized membrane protein YcgQ (UPF0703/DUF1980 family)